MLNFDTYLYRFGEAWVQGLVERMERVESIRPRFHASLEERWNAVMQNSETNNRVAA
ncbi:MAG: hypothetical protein P4M15_03565 [Alphaproteobacteria bacterium]|nr:hypothetical protein [Alphaproteobacteria bacterium]